MNFSLNHSSRSSTYRKKENCKFSFVTKHALKIKNKEKGAEWRPNRDAALSNPMESTPSWLYNLKKLKERKKKIYPIR